VKHLKIYLFVIILTVITTLGMDRFVQDSASGILGTKKVETAQERVIRTGIIRCAYVTLDPYIYRDLGSKNEPLRGPTVDVAEAVADALSLKIEWTAEVTFAEFAEGFKSNRYDAFCGHIAMAPGRARVAAFTDPVYYVPYYVFARPDETRFTSLSEANTSDFQAAVIDGEVFQFMTQKYVPG